MIEWLKAIFDISKANNEFLKSFEQRLTNIENSIKTEEKPNCDGDGSSVEKTKEDE